MGVEPLRHRGRCDSRRGPDAEHRVRLVVDGYRVDHGHDAEHPRLAHPGDPVADGSPRYAELLPDYVIGGAPVVLQHTDDPLVEVVVRGRQLRDPAAVVAVATAIDGRGLDWTHRGSGHVLVSWRR